MSQVAMITNATTTPVTGDWVTPRKSFARDIFVARGNSPKELFYQGHMSFLADVTGVGTLGATIVIEGTNGGSGVVTLGTITLAGDDLVADGFIAQNAMWDQVRARITALTGTAAKCNVRMGV